MKKEEIIVKVKDFKAKAEKYVEMPNAHNVKKTLEKIALYNEIIDYMENSVKTDKKEAKPTHTKCEKAPKKATHTKCEKSPKQQARENAFIEKSKDLPKVKTITELKSLYGKDFKGIENNYFDLKDLAVNGIRCFTSKTISEMPLLAKNCVEVIPLIILDIQKYGYDKAIRMLKKGDMHKAYSRKDLYEHYGLDYFNLKHSKQQAKKGLL